MITENYSQGCVQGSHKSVQKTLTDEQMQVLKSKGLDVSGNMDLADVLGILPKHIKDVWVDCPLKVAISNDSDNWYIYYEDQQSPCIERDNLLNAAYEMLIWLIDNGHIHTNKQNKAFPHISRQQIIDKLTDWFSNGILTTTQIVGEQPRVIESLCNKRELSYTPINRLLLVGDSKDSEVFKELKSLIDGRRILAPLTAKVETDTRTDYGVLQASKRGELYRFVHGGLILYID